MINQGASLPGYRSEKAMFRVHIYLLSERRWLFTEVEASSEEKAREWAERKAQGSKFVWIFAMR